MPYIFFLLYVIAVLTCGSIKIGPYSLRIYMTLLMLAYLILIKKPTAERQYKIRTDYIHLFVVCIIMLGISLMMNGGMVAFAFWEKCLAYYLLCIVAYFAVDRFVKCDSHFDKLVFVFSLIVIFDAIVTILQYQNNPIGWGLGAVFSEVDEFAEFLNDHDSFVGVSKLPGIFGHPVNNGFFLSVSTLYLLTGIGRNKGVLSSVYYVFAILVSLVACLFLQQRAAIFLIIIFSAYHYFREFLKHPSKIIIPTLIIILLLIFLLPSDWTSFDFGRLSKTDNDSRTSVWQLAFDVIFKNPLFGDILSYNKAAEYSAHNVLIDSLIDSGIFGFIPMFILCFKTVIDSIRLMLHTNNNYARIFSYSVLTCMGMGMFHNSSYLTGEVIIFISLALMFKAHVLAKNKPLQA